MTIAATAIADLVAALAGRTPTPGGGAAAAVGAALGCAAGAMAARYTTGPRWAAVAEQATALAETLDRAAAACLAAADADAQAYGAVVAARAHGGATLEDAERAAAAVPADLLAACALGAASLRGFLDACNPHLRSDVACGIHLLAGAGRSAWHTLLVNRPAAQVVDIARGHLAALAAAEAAAMGADGA